MFTFVQSIRNAKWRPFWCAGVYLSGIAYLGGMRWDHWAMAGLLTLDAYHERTRRFLAFFLPFVLTGMMYDSMRYFYWAGVSSHIHIAAPYVLEKALFGLTVGGQRLTLNEYFLVHHWIWADLLCGFAYLTFVAHTMFVAFALLLSRHEKTAGTFTWSFFVVNALGYLTYFLYPAAPPWYVSQYGFGPARLDVRPDAAAGHRFDQILGTHLFDQMYGKGIDVFGAYPSLHVAYPLLASWAVFRCYPRLGWPNLAFYFLMCFSAIYLQHHYVIDVILGTIYAAITWKLVNGFRKE